MDRTERYSALLQPIRDLAQNWSIDVARDLEEYLEELESIQISLDGGRSTLNFAEAAMLIQGSAAVYSRKVEYLYALIYQTLDMITANKNKAAANGGKVKPRDVQDADADELLRHEAEEEFLLLEAVKEGKAVDLKEKREEVELQAALTYGYSGRAHAAAAAAASSLQHMLNLTTLKFDGNSSNNSSNSSLMHVGDVSGLPGLNLNITMARSILASPAATKAKSALLARTPLARMTLAGSIGGVSTIGGIGGVGGFGQPGAGIGGFFRVANSSVDFATGALMLPGGGEHQLSQSILTLEPAFIADPASVVDAVTSAVGTMHDQNQPAVESGGVIANNCIDNHDYDDDSGGGGGFDENGWFHDALPPRVDSVADVALVSDLDPMAPETNQQQRVPLPRSVKVSSSSSSSSSSSAAAVIAPPKKKLDPWAALDPSADLGPSSHRPFIAARTWVHIPDPTLVAARGPEAAAAAIAAQRARTLNMGGKADASSLRLAKVLSAQAKLLASRANAARASGPILIPKAVLSGREVAIPNSASSGYSSTLSALTSCVGTGTTKIFEIVGKTGITEDHYSGLFYVPIDKAMATFSSDAAVAASAGARAGCGYEFAHLIARQKAAGQRARRSQRSAIAAAFPEQAAAGAAYDDAAFLGGGDENDYDGGGGGDYDNFDAPAEVRPAYSDALNTGETESDHFAPPSGDIIIEEAIPVMGVSGTTTAAAAAAAATLGMNLDDPMAFLNDVVQGDAAYKAEKASQKSRSEAAMANAIQNAQGLMTSLDGEDDAFHAAVRAQIAAFTANADAFLASSRMQRRIEGWQRRMEPLLEEEEARPEFNMRVYGDQIVKALSTAAGSTTTSSSSSSAQVADSTTSDGETLALKEKSVGNDEPPSVVFSSLVNKLKPKPYEICRLFLATLQLANNGNVDIVQQQQQRDGGIDQEVAMTSGSKSGPGAGLYTPPIRGQQDSARLGFSIRLLSSASMFDDIHAFKPPSDQRDDGRQMSSHEALVREEEEEEDEEEEENDEEGEGNYESSVRGKRAKRARDAMIAVLSPTKAKATNKRSVAAASTSTLAARPPLPPAAEKRGRPLGPTNAAAKPQRASKRSKSRDSETAAFDALDENDEVVEESIADAAVEDDEAVSSAVTEKVKASSRASSRSKKAIIFGEADEEESLRSPKGKKAAIR